MTPGSASVPLVVFYTGNINSLARRRRSQVAERNTGLCLAARSIALQRAFLRVFDRFIFERMTTKLAMSL